MKININIPATPKRTRILAAFMAFLIFALTFQEAFVGWDFGIRVSAANYGTDVYTGVSSSAFMTAGTASTEDSRYVYSGKMKTNDVTLFDYVSNNEVEGATINLGVGSGGYHDPYGYFNEAISKGSVVSSYDDNITVVLENAGTGDKWIYLWDSSGDHGYSWPGQKMTYLGDNKYIISVCFFLSQNRKRLINSGVLG